MRKVDISASDLFFKLRVQGVYVARGVERAILEQDGQFIITSFGEGNPRYPLITNGSIQPAILEMIDKDGDWLLTKLKTQGIAGVGTISLVECDSGKITIAEYRQ